MRLQMTEKPDYVLNFPRQKNTEIKKIGHNWYLYERFSKYDPAIKRSRKISGKCLGKITSDGLVATKRRLVDEQKKSFPLVRFPTLSKPALCFISGSVQRRCVNV